MPDHFNRSLWINVGIVAGSFILFGVVFSFMSQSLATISGQILMDREAIAARSANQEDLTNLKANAAAASDFQKKINALLPTQDGLIDFPQYLSSLASAHSLSLTSSYIGTAVNPAPPVPGYFMFTADVQGQPSDIQGFMSDAETKTTRFLISFQQVSLTPNGSNYRADLGGEVFFQANPSNQ